MKPSKKILSKIILYTVILILFVSLLTGCLEEENQDIDKDKITNSLNLAESWFISNFKEKGCFNYIYDPISEEYSSSNNMIRQLMASRLLGEMCKENKSLEELHQKNLDFIFQHWYGETDDVGYIYYNGKSKLGANAMALRTLVYSPFFNNYQEEAEKLANSIFSLQDPDGSFFPWYIDPGYVYDSEGEEQNYNDRLLTFYSGEAILSLVEMYEKTKNITYLNSSILSQDYYIGEYITRLDENYYPAYVPWHTLSLNKLYKITGEQKYVDAIFVLNDKLLEILDTTNNPTLGRFYNASTPQYGTPHSSSDGVYTEGLAYAYEIAVLTDDEDHQKLYLDALNLAIDNLVTLQYDESDAKIFNYPKRVIGAFPYNVEDSRMRIDTTQHTMDAFRKILGMF